MTFTEDELALMTEAERAIALEADPEDEDTPLDDPDDTVSEAADPESEGGDKEEGDELAALPEPTAAAAVVDEAPASAPAQAPIYTAVAPEDAEGLRQQALQDKQVAFAKLLEGEITGEEYAKVESQVLARLRDIDRAELKAELAAEMTQQQQAKEWERVLQDMAKRAKAEGLDYVGDAGKRDELEGLLRVFSHEAAAKGMSDGEGLKASRWALDQAHAVMKLRHGVVAAAPVAPAARVAAPKAPDLAAIPPTLARAPVAANAAVRDEFAHLEGLHGADLERAVARMTPDQQDRYLQ